MHRAVVGSLRENVNEPAESRVLAEWKLHCCCQTALLFPTCCLFVLQQKAKEAAATSDEQQTEAIDSGLRWRRRHVEVFLPNMLVYRYLSAFRKHNVAMGTP